MSLPIRPAGSSWFVVALLFATAIGVLMLTGVPLAIAATRPAPAAPSAVSIASPGSGIPIVGRLVDSVVGIVTGTFFGISGATRAVACSIAPTCPPVPGRDARRARR
jgi:hypothetical protein